MSERLREFWTEVIVVSDLKRSSKSERIFGTEQDTTFGQRGTRTAPERNTVNWDEVNKRFAHAKK